MNRNLILLIAAGALGLILIAVAMKPGSFPETTSPELPDAQSQTESADATAAKAMVARALEYLDEHGTAALIEKVNAAAPEFHQGQFYVFVLDNAGTIVAHPIDPDWVGITDETGRDADGNAFLARMAAAAAENPDGSWFDYRWPHPATKEVGTKSSWVVMRDDHVVGVGIYLEEE
ncbi:MAG: cache domain-containing protein [Gammaproteobacteria bacterium]|nr:cache domain-containing protein [Gammaproteobacteria bacterium]MDE0302820.1 cache domain-containing protein [Gammaproteobacteria bacterium]